jgi:uncharacterized protein
MAIPGLLGRPPDLGRPGGIEALRLQPIILKPCGWRLSTFPEYRAGSFWPARPGRIYARCARECGRTPPQTAYGCGSCGIHAYTAREEAQRFFSGLPRGPNLVRALVRVRLHGRALPDKSPNPKVRSAVRATSLSLEAVYLPDEERPVQKTHGVDLDAVAADPSAYGVPVEVRPLRNLAIFPTLEPLFERMGQKPQAGRAWRFVRPDYSSPYGHNGRKITTLPGDQIDLGGQAIWASRDPQWLCLAVLQSEYRALYVEYRLADVLSEHGVEIRLSRCTIVGELDGPEIAMLAAGANPAPIIRRMLGGDSPAGDLFETLLPVALAHWTNRGSKIHGPDHWRRVAENGVTLAVETPGADARVVQAFAALHDSQRRTDGGDPEHGARAAELARSLDLAFDDDQLQLLYAALIEHAQGLVSDNPTIGACWDADRLDLVRLGIQPRPALLSTDAAKMMT